MLQEHPVVVPTMIDPVPPVAVLLTDSGVTVNTHVLVAAAACVTVKVFPAIVSVPERDVVPVLAVAENATVPFPVPLAPDVIDSHDTLSVVVHVQPAATVTVTEPVPPDAPTDAAVEFSAGAHTVAAENPNVLVSGLDEEPPGPFADTMPA